MRGEGIVVYAWIIGLVTYFCGFVWAFGHGWGPTTFIATLIWLLRRWNRK